MPYRRLPTTDLARLRAMKAASEKADQLEMNELAFSARFIHPLRNYHDQLETVKHQQTQSWKQIVAQNKKYHKINSKSRMYLTHFVQVLNMAIEREEMTPESRRYYDLDPESAKVPKMIANSDLLVWGKRIIEGEGKRIRTGGAPIMSPTIGKVKVWYEKFRDLHHSQEIAKQSYQRASEQLVDLRRKIDGLIQLLWDEIEEHYHHLPEAERREESAQYGVVYVYRKNERKLAE